MSTIRATTNESIFKIDKFLGLHENPDGDTKLKLGEASVCKNWKVTRDRNLKRRSGFHQVSDLGTGGHVMGMWFGNVNGSEYGLAAAGGKLWKFYENDEYLDSPENLGTLTTTNHVSFFPFSNIVYILTGFEYCYFDGTTFAPVEGYVPLVATARSPEGADGTILEEVNKLSPKRRVWFSPDGTATNFLLPESGIAGVNYVTYLDGSGTSYRVADFEQGGISLTTGKNASSTTRIRTHGYIDESITAVGLKDGVSNKFYAIVGYEDDDTYLGYFDGLSFEQTATWITDEIDITDIRDEFSGVKLRLVMRRQSGDIPVSDALDLKFTAEEDWIVSDTDTGTVTFESAPVRGVNTIEIEYSAKVDYHNDVLSMTNAELFLGAQDNAVFLYGNGTNKAIYSSVDYDGSPRADYFPDLNEVSVADDNTPITSMIRHYSQLICYKTNSAYSIQYGPVIDAEGNSHWAFYVKPVNKSIGNVALGQVQLVQNSPYTLHGNDLYEWVNTSRYSTNLSIDERQAKRVSDRIYATLATFDLKNCICYDDNDNQEYYIWDGNNALVFNYAADAWYTYTAPVGRSVHSMCNLHYDLLFGFDDGTIHKLNEVSYSDNGIPFDSYWESGSIDFGKPYQRKFVSEVWVGTKPNSHSKVSVTVVTDRKSDYAERLISNSLSSFVDMNFNDFTFFVNRKPQIKKLKLKAKKFAFLKFILKSSDEYNTATVLLIDPKVRETGYVK